MMEHSPLSPAHLPRKQEQPPASAALGTGTAVAWEQGWAPLPRRSAPNGRKSGEGDGEGGLTVGDRGSRPGAKRGAGTWGSQRGPLWAGRGAGARSSPPSPGPAFWEFVRTVPFRRPLLAECEFSAHVGSRSRCSVRGTGASVSFLCGLFPGLDYRPTSWVWLVSCVPVTYSPPNPATKIRISLLMCENRQAVSESAVPWSLW